MIIKKGQTSVKYILIVVILAAIVGGGTLWYVSLMETPSIFLPNVSRAKIVFDICYRSTEAPSGYDGTKNWVHVFVVPRVINYENKEAVSAFNNYTEIYMCSGVDYGQLKKGISEKEIEEVINSLSDKYEIFSECRPDPSYFLRDGLLSIVLDCWSMGGAHPIQWKTVFNYDLQNHKGITIDDVLTINKNEIISLIKKKLIEELKSLGPDKLPPSFSREKVPCPESELDVSHFYFTDNELVIMITGHRLSTYFCWPNREFRFSFSELEKVIKKDGPISRLLQ